METGYKRDVGEFFCCKKILMMDLDVFVLLDCGGGFEDRKEELFPLIAPPPSPPLNETSLSLTKDLAQKFRDDDFKFPKKKKRFVLGFF